MTINREANSSDAGAFLQGGGKDSISFKVGIIFSLVTLLSMANVYVVHTLLASFEGMAETVNVTGRLRMLTQKYAYDASKMLYAEGGDHLLLATSEDVQTTLHALVAGGNVAGYKIAPLAERSLNQVMHLRAEWQAFEAAVWSAYGSSGEGLSAAKLEKMEIVSGRLLALADGLVHAVTADAQRKRSTTLMKIYALALMNVILLALLWLFSRIHITRPLNDLAYMGRLLGMGQFDRRVSSQYRGEIGQLASALNYAAGQISESLRQMKRDREQLAQAEAMFRGLADNSMAGVYIVKEGRFAYVNQKMADMCGYGREEMLASVPVAALFADRGSRVLGPENEPLAAGLMERLNDAVAARRKDGSLFEVEIFGSQMRLNDELATIGIMLDVTERNRANRGIWLLSACNQAVMHAVSEAEMQQAVCGILARIGRYPLVWIGMVEHGRLQPSAQVQGEEAARAHHSVSLERTRETAENAVLTNQTIVARIENPLPESGASHGGMEKGKLLRAVSIPLRQAGQAVGALTIHAREPDTFGENEVVVLEEVAANLAYGMFALQTEALRQEYVRKLEHQAHHDVLTGLANRSLLSDRLKQAMAMAQRLERQVAVLLLDLDRFKHINDTYGHAAGDVLLQTVAARLRASVRKTDTVARIGGDEFVVLLTNIRGEEEVRAIAEKILAAFADPIALGEVIVQTRSSLGIALYPRDGEQESLLMKRADRAMYHAKQQGYSGFHFYSVALEAASAPRAS